MAVFNKALAIFNGEWNDFPENITASLRDVFQYGKSAMEEEKHMPGGKTPTQKIRV